MSFNAASRSRGLRSSLLLGVASVAAVWSAGPAAAQDQSVETVVVTGSRIPQTGLYSSSPVTVVGSQEVQLQGAVNSEQLLNQLPQNIGGMTSGFDISSDGTAEVSLRGLGPNRTLVLVDGKRYVPSNIGGAAGFGGVDLDAIPTAIIDHVEVVTGGASAVYGSDAVAGVVNILLKHDFEGAEISGTYSAYPDYHMDGQTADVNGMLGFSSGDGKGNVTAWGGYTHRQSIPQGTRKFGAEPLVTDGQGGFFFRGSQTIPQGGFYILNGPHAYPQYDANRNHVGGGDGGFCYHYDPTGATSNPGMYKFGVGGVVGCDTYGQNVPAAEDSFNYNPQQLNQTEQVRYNFGANGHYEVNKSLDLYARVMYSNTRINTQIASTPIAGTFNINADNPFLSAQEKDLLFGTPTPAAGTPDASVFLFKRALDFGPRRTEFTFDSFEMVAGAKGDLGSGWSYDVSAQYGKSESQQWNTGFVSTSNFQDSIRVVDNGAGGFACASGNAGCVPYNIYNLDPASPGQPTAATIAFDGVNYALLTQVAETDIQGSLAGDLGSWGVQSPWAKDPVALSVGAEYRQEQGFVRPDNTLATGNAAGLSGATPPASGAFNVKEGFGEIKIPLVEGMPFVEDLELEGAYRYSSYSNAGATSTYKYGGSWAPTDDFKLRALWQRAVRAPNIGELFSPQAIALASGTDPCVASNNPGATPNLQALCIATGAHVGQSNTCNSGQCNVLVGGNPNLKPEVADTKTFGLVFTPTFIDGLTATVDYYDIKITGAVGTQAGSPQGIFQGCYSPPGGITNVAAQAASVYCQAVHRDGTGGFRASNGFISQINANTGQLNPTGIDVGVNYQMDLADMGWNDAGGLAFNLNGTYQDKAVIQGDAILPKGDCAGYYGNFCGVPDPKYRFNFRVNWTSPSGDWLLSGRWRYIGSVKLDTDYCIGAASTCVVTPANFDLSDHKIDPVSYFDFTAVWNVRDGISLTAGLQNAFNKKPPIVDNTIDANENNSNTFPGVYDIQGRMLFVSGSVKF
ncbi:MAG TPA: TonB-dependent receptor [Rhizomicrobium sp.]